MEEIINIRKEIAKQSEVIADSIYLEEYIDGENFNLISLFDGKNLLSFTNDKLIIEYSEKLKEMLISENIQFIGFLTSKLIIKDRMVYNTGFSADLSDINLNIDFIYLLNSAIYQKLNEIHYNT